MGRKLLIILMMLSLNSMVYADSALTAITVTPQKRPIRVIDTLNSVEIITSNDIRKYGFATTDELLNHVSSINIGSNGGFGQTKSIFLRGTESNHTKVLINGIELNPATLGVPSIQHIPPEIIERVEISKNGMSALYGKDALGGVINIITKNDINNIFSLKVGRHDSRRLTLSKNLITNNHEAFINISRMLSDSYKAKVSSSQDHGYENKVIDLRYQYKNKNYQYFVDYYFNDGLTEYDSFGSNLSQTHKDNHFRVMLVDENDNNETKFSYIRKGNEINQSADLATDYTHTKVDSISIEKSIHNFFSTYSLFGISYSDESMYELSYGTSFKTSNNVREFFFNTYYRYDNNVDFNIGMRHIHHSVYGDYLTGNINYGRKFNEKSMAYAGISKSFRAPDATDLYGYSGNPNLEPEESISYELGVKSIISFGDLSLTYFNNNITDLIESDGTKMQNINKARIKGIELDYTNKISDKLNYSFKYTYQEPDDITNDTMLSRRSRNKVISTLSNQINKNNLIGITMIGQSKRDNSIYDNHSLGGYAIFNVNYITNIEDYELSIKMNNIFDRKYRLAHDYNTEGRSIYLTLTTTFM